MSKNDVSEFTKKHHVECSGEITREAADAAKDAVKLASERAKDAAGLIEDAAGHATDATKNAAKCCAGKAKDLYQTAAVKTEHAMTASKECVRRNPVVFILGAVVFGAAIGSVVMIALRKPSFAERYEDEPLGAVRDAILGALAPVTHRVHQGYDTARDGAGKAMARMNGFGSNRSCDSISDRISRMGNNLKFW